VNKTVESAKQVAECILLHSYSCTNCSSQLHKHKQKLHIAYLTSWRMRLKILKKLRTASLNSEFTGSYNKKCNSNIKCIVLQNKTRITRQNKQA